MKLSEIQKILDAKVLYGHEKLDEDIFACGAADLMEDVLQATTKGAVLLTGLTTIDVIRISTILEIGAVVFVRGKMPEISTLELAKAYDLPVLSTTRSLFVSCGRLYMNGLRGIDGYW